MPRPISYYDQSKKSTPNVSSSSNANVITNQHNPPSQTEQQTEFRPSVAALSKMFDQNKTDSPQRKTLDRFNNNNSARNPNLNHLQSPGSGVYVKSHSADVLIRPTDKSIPSRFSPQRSRSPESTRPTILNHHQNVIINQESNAFLPFSGTGSSQSRNPSIPTLPGRTFSTGSIQQKRGQFEDGSSSPSTSQVNETLEKPSTSVSRLSQIFEQHQISSLNPSIHDQGLLQKDIVVSPTVKHFHQSLVQNDSVQSALPPPKPRKPEFLHVPSRNELNLRGRTHSSPVVFQESSNLKHVPLSNYQQASHQGVAQDIPLENPFESPSALISTNNPLRGSQESLPESRSSRATIVIPRDSAASNATIAPSKSQHVVLNSTHDLRKSSRTPPSLSARPAYYRQGSISSGLRHATKSSDGPDDSDAESHVSMPKSSSTHSITVEENPEKRLKVVGEIVDTERSFLADMRVLDEIYVQTKGLPDSDHKLLFSNLPHIIDVSTELSRLLDSNPDLQQIQIGLIFNQMLGQIETAYCSYCKHNDASLSKLAEYNDPHCPDLIKSFLEACRHRLTGRTGAWDLGSLIVKPVQRVLKYPLLLKQLLKYTPETHPDYDNLIQALETSERVAEKINEVKKRVDIVEKYVGGKTPTNVMHGISKKWTRGTQQLMKVTGLADDTAPDDANYDQLMERYNLAQKSVHQLKADTLMWIKSLRDFIEMEEGFAAAFADAYFLDTPSQVRDTSAGNDYPVLVRKYFKATSRLMGGPWKDAVKSKHLPEENFLYDTRVKTSLIPALDTLANRFREPQLIIKKHDAKRLDYERMHALIAKGEQPDKLLIDSADAFEAIHAQLLEELPKFLSLVSEYISYCTLSLIDIQSCFYSDMKNAYLASAGALVNPLDTTSDIIPKFLAQWKAGSTIEQICRNLGLLKSWRNEVWDAAGNYQISDTPLETNDLVNRIPSLSRQTASLSRQQQQQTSPPLIDIHGSAPPPRPILHQTDSDAILRNTVLVSHKTLQPTKAPRSTGLPSNEVKPVLLTRTRTISSYQSTPSRDDTPVSTAADRVRNYSTLDSHSRGSTASDIFDDNRAIPEIEIQDSGHSYDVTPSLSSIPTSLSLSTESMPDIEQLRRERGQLQAKSPPFFAVSVYAFEAEMEDEIHLLVGSNVEVLQIGGRNGAPNEDWWFGRAIDDRIASGGGRTEGWFPGNYVMPL